MGSLKPGVTCIHERVDNVVYRREVGADPSTRQVVGWDYDPNHPNFDPRKDAGFAAWGKKFADNWLWGTL